MLTSPIPTINLFLLLHSLLKGVSDAKYKVKKLVLVAETTSVNSVVYGQKWAWPRKRACRIGSRSRKKLNPIIFHNNNTQTII